MVCTVAEPQKKLPVFKPGLPGKWNVSQHHKIALFGRDREAKNMKQFTLHFQSIAQKDTLDFAWFGEVWFPVDKKEWDANYMQTQDNIVDPDDLDLEFSFSQAQARDPACALLDSGATHVLLLGHMLPKGARSVEVTINLAVGKEKAQCCTQ